jgi:hypothetical protein
MKKLLLSVFALCSIGFAGAQTYAIYDYQTTTDISGTVVNFTTDGTSFYDGHFTVVHLTGDPVELKIRRVQIAAPATEVDEQVCWGSVPDDGTGTCIPFTSAAMTWVSPNIATVNNASNVGDLKIEIMPTPSSAGNHFRYYLESTDGSRTHYDSLDVKINYTAAVKEVKNNVSFNVFPNPANDQINVALQGTGNDNTVRLIDVLGNVVFEERMTGAKKQLDVSNYKNGVYILSVYNNGNLLQTKRIVVRH